MLSLSTGLKGAAKGTLAGMAGTAVVQLLSMGDHRKPVYHPDRLASRLVARHLHRALSPAEGRRLGMLLRWLYGPGWGSAFGEVQERLRLPYAIAGLALGGTVWLFELVALPLSGATPQLKAWGAREIARDGFQAVLFGVATASALAILDD